jgi:uncharacterized membrane protein
MSPEKGELPESVSNTGALDAPKESSTPKLLSKTTDPPVEKRLRESVEAAIAPEVAPEKRAHVVRRVVAAVSEEFYQGPLPHPKHLQAYEEACPGSASRILAMAEKAQDRYETRLDKAMDYEFADRRLGLFLGFFALLAILIAGVIIIALGQTLVGTGLLAAAGISTVIGAFIRGRGADYSSVADGDGADEEDDENDDEAEEQNEDDRGVRSPPALPLAGR